MKYIKNVFSFICVFILIVSVITGTIHCGKIVKMNQEYKQYYHEQVDIQIMLRGSTYSLSKKSDYPKFNRYESMYDEVKRVYKEIGYEKLIKDMTISNYMIMIMKYHENYHFKHEYQMIDHEYFENGGYEIVEGRYFTEEEIQEGKRVILLNEIIVHETDIPWENEKIEIGEMVEIQCLNNEVCSSVEFEVIGFYRNSVDNREHLDKIYDTFVPNQAIVDLSDLWMEEAKDEENVYNCFYPMGIMNPLIHVNSEAEYDEVKDLIGQYKKGSSFDFYVERKDSHKILDSYFDTKDDENGVKKSFVVSVCTILFIVFLEVTQYSIKKQEKKKFEMILSNEQEKNVQAIMLMNQESHKLKHDLKHLFVQVSTYIKKNENEKALELIEGYHEEILSLDIPAYTNHQTVDMLLNHYLNISKKRNINFTYSGNMIPNLKIDDRKLYILLSNALENAFIHGDATKTIKLVIGYARPYCRFVISNAITHKFKQDESEHGYGLISMRKIVNEAHGEMTCEIVNNKYICTILIPIE